MCTCVCVSNELGWPGTRLLIEERQAQEQRLSSLYNQWFRFLFQKLCQLHPQAPNWGLSLSLLLKDRLCRGAAGGSGQEADM